MPSRPEWKPPIPVVVTPDLEPLPARSLWQEWPERTFCIPARTIQNDGLSWEELLGQR
ncbi:hypothetical protein [Synechococcus sp. LTW-R]|uniref:hypothetical protein n=1 Tax=Synechococcus sp. LTW-R TaxID=2751170 RepID=UPI0016272489|nr:hypothetical protein [Synechococcus sp. LTW-R]QNG30678.1 hypothetical protein H0O22_06255 [Synechococcus sp. LTW-R]